MDKKKVWFVTGASKGLGLALVKKLLKEGYMVAATSRSNADLHTAIGKRTENFLPLQVDLINGDAVAESLEKTIDAFGAVHFVVNNAGYGQLGTLEELSDEEARQNFDVNVFGALNVIREVMPHFRKQKAGAIFNISSVGGFVGSFPGWGIYCATKFAMAGLTEALAAEAKSLGISATVVYPGYFRTNFLSKGSLAGPKNPIAAYTDARVVQDVHENQIKGNQPGDPDKAAAALIAVAEQPTPPVHLFLGPDAYTMATSKIETIQKDLLANELLGTGTNY